MTPVQFDRDYSLYLGWWDTPTAPQDWLLLKQAPKRDGVLVKDLQIEFDINKVISNQQSPSVSKIRVYNMSEEQTSAIKEFECGVRLLVGYKGANNIGELCTGNATVVKTRKEGANRVTEFILSESHAIMNSTKIISSIPSGKTLEDVIMEVVRQSGMTKGLFEGEQIKTKMLYGYPIMGTPKQILDEIAHSYRLDYDISNGKLNVRDKGKTLYADKGKAFVLNERTGLLEIPHFEEWGEGSRKIEGNKKKEKVRVEGIVVKALLNPAVVPGSVIKLDREEDEENEVKNDLYVVREGKYSGSFFGRDWNMELRCDPIGAYK